MTPTTDGSATPDVTYRDAMRDVIAARWETVWALMPAVKTSEDPEAVHKLRVASRRLRAAMDVAPASFPQKRYRPLHNTAKDITRSMGALRDDDVLLETLSREHEEASDLTRPGIDHLMDIARKERKRARKSALRFIGSLESRQVQQETMRIFSGASEPSKKSNTAKVDVAKTRRKGTSRPGNTRGIVSSLDPAASLSTNARRVLAFRTNDLFAYAPVIPDESATEQHHDARIATKRLRYTLELFPCVFGEEGVQAIAQLQALQEALGQLHDADVRIERIEKELAGLKKKAPQALRHSLDALLVQERANRRTQHATVVAGWQAMEQAGLRERLEALAALDD